MVIIAFHHSFEKRFSKIKDKKKLLKLLEKIKDNPSIGKPMRYGRKRTRELYSPPFRLSYTYLEKENKVVILNYYHKDKQ